MHKQDFRRELAEYRLDNMEAISIDLRPHADLFFIEQPHFLLPAIDGFYLKGSALPLLHSSLTYTDVLSNSIDITELINNPKDVYLAGNKILSIELLKNKKNFWLSENDLQYISAIKLIAKHAIEYFKVRTKSSVNKDKLNLNEILNEGGLMCYRDNTLSEYFNKLEYQLESFINKAYYNTYKLNISSNCLTIIKDIDLRIEEWYMDKISECETI